jgi:hypothetical protein
MFERRDPGDEDDLVGACLCVGGGGLGGLAK